MSSLQSAQGPPHQVQDPALQSVQVLPRQEPSRDTWHAALRCWPPTESQVSLRWNRNIRLHAVAARSRSTPGDGCDHIFSRSLFIGATSKRTHAQDRVYHAVRPRKPTCIYLPLRPLGGRVEISQVNTAAHFDSCIRGSTSKCEEQCTLYARSENVFLSTIVDIEVHTCDFYCGCKNGTVLGIHHQL